VTNEPDSLSADMSASDQSASDQSASDQDVANNQPKTFAPRPTLGRGFGAYAQPQAGYPSPQEGYSPAPASRRNHPAAQLAPNSAATGNFNLPEEHIGGPTADTTFPAPGVTPPAPRIWERQPYAFVAYFLTASGAITTAWLFGVLVAQVLPGQFDTPPLQESLLRKSSRLTRRLWHFPQLWHTPTTQVRIDAIPLPETGPVLEAVDLSPIERQPLIDELNAVETEILTLDRRLQALEKQLGRPPYQGLGIESRINTMRTAIESPTAGAIAPNTYEPIAQVPSDTLLDVAKLKVTLPSDALFSPGDAELKDVALLERVLDQLVNYPAGTISVRSHSDNQVGAIASREYTLAQADTLARYLQQNLPTSHRWIAVGMGSTQPITGDADADNADADNVDAIERQRNRRIEILVDTRP